MKTAPIKIDRAARRVVGIAGPVHTDFSHYCSVLDLDLQQVATTLIAGWNKRIARRVLRRSQEKTARLAECVTSAQP